ncbi:hypothetical protein SprV_0802625600 [Sparganum proliferum]
MLRQLRDGMIVRIADNSSVSDAFLVTNGAKQHCVLSPALFSLTFPAMLLDAYHDERPRIGIAYRTDGHINGRRIQARTRLSTTIVHDLRFVDDCVFNTVTEVDMRRSLDFLAAEYINFGLTINADGTLAMHQPSTNTQHCTPPRITVGSHQLKIMDNLAYHGSARSNSTRIDDKVAHRISKVSEASCRCRTPHGIVTGSS